jgi:hypothetical protein
VKTPRFDASDIRAQIILHLRMAKTLALRAQERRNNGEDASTARRYAYAAFINAKWWSLRRDALAAIAAARDEVRS